MKNSVGLLLVAAVLSAGVLGCSWINPFSGSKESGSSRPAEKEKSAGDKAVEVAVGDEKIGIPECDAVMDELMAQTKSEEGDEGYVAKAFRQYWENTIREAIRKSVEDNKNDPEKLAAECRKIKVQLDRFKAEEESKKAQ